MKVSLIGQNFDKGSGQGVYEFSNQLYSSLKKIDNNIEIIESGTSKNSLITLFNNIFISSYKALKNKSDIYHFMMPELAFSSLFKRPSIIVIHDLIPLIINERRKSFNLYFKLMMKIAIRADHLIAVSKSTKKDLINILKVPEDKISVIYEGVNSENFYPQKRKKNSVFVIGYIGGLGKRKNLDYVLDIANEFKNNKKILFKVAGKGPELDRLINLKKERRLKNVEFLGFVPKEELNNFYNSLDLFIFPSFYEGFGLPIIEAMACGIPIMASSTSSLIEIAKDTGILIDPEKPEDAIKRIKRIIKSPGLQKKLRVKSIKKAKEFKWDKTASEIFKTYKKFK
jgi:glycosyltransferase involved in cell wall biosynthesis